MAYHKPFTILEVVEFIKTDVVFAHHIANVHATHLCHRVEVYGLLSWNIGARQRKPYRDWCGATRPYTLPLSLSKPTAGITLGLAIIMAIRYMTSPWRKVPPSPPRLPILGNVLQLRDKRWLLSKDCKERFGEFTDNVQCTQGGG